MDTKKLKQICGGFPGAESTLHEPPSNILVYSVGNKNFAYFKTSEPEKCRFSIRVTPDRFVELTGVPGIKPARYMGRFHWVTIVNPNAVSSDYLTELIEWSYQKALGSLTKARRAMLIGVSSPDSVSDAPSAAGAARRPRKT